MIPGAYLFFSYKIFNSNDKNQASLTMTFDLVVTLYFFCKQEVESPLPFEWLNHSSGKLSCVQTYQKKNRKQASLFLGKDAKIDLHMRAL